MNKSDLIDEMAKDAGISKIAAKKALNSILENIEKSLSNGQKVTIVGFGSWSVGHRAAREGRNPRTGQTIKLSARKVVKFRPGSELKGGSDDTGPMKNY